jgi:hypothetical protein
MPTTGVGARGGRVAAAFVFACVHLDGTAPPRATVGRYEVHTG